MTAESMNVEFAAPIAGSNPPAVKWGRSPLLWGTLATVGFYFLIPLFTSQREFFQRYFCSHWILYATTWLFALGMAILIGKGLRLPSEKATFVHRLARNPQILNEPDWHRRLECLQRDLDSVPVHQRHSHLIRRYQDVAEYLDARRDSDTLEDHLKYLHDVAGEKLHDSYALIRTITWAIPILGFLGTVIGITIAIANITPDQLEKSMSEVTSGLAVAFDTTALSLSLSMILVFISFVTERSEQSVLSEVESLGMRDIAPAFTSVKVSRSPIDRAEQQAANQILERTEDMVNWQTDLWKDSLEGLRSRWEHVIQQQQVSFANSLQEGMRGTLRSHHEELSLTRQELVAGLQQMATQLAELTSDVQNRVAAQQLSMGEKLTALWVDVQTELHEIRKEQAQQIELLTRSFREDVLSWQTQLKDATQSTTGQVKELQTQGQTLLKIVGEEVELNRLQKSLTSNLEALNATDTFEKALHSLTAAVHMMTIRNRAA